MAYSIWWLGLIISVFASLAGVLGNQAIRMSHLKKSEACINPLWLLGMFMIVIVNSGGHLAAMAFASQTLLAPLAALTIVLNTITDPWFLNEPMTRKDYIGTAVTFAGATLVVVFGPHKSHEENHDEDANVEYFKELYRANGFLLYLMISGVLMFVMAAFSLMRKKYPAPAKLAMPMLGGFVGGFSGTFAKTTVDLLQAAADGHPIFKDIFSYAIFVGAIVCAVSQLRLLDMSLKHYPAMYVVPVYQSALTINGTLASAIYFQDFVGAAVGRMLLFSLGGLLACVGIVCITAGSPPPADDEEAAEPPIKATYASMGQMGQEGEEDPRRKLLLATDPPAINDGGEGNSASPRAEAGAYDSEEPVVDII